jgi:hypothetical protein
MSMPGSSMPGASGSCMNRLNSFSARYSLLRATTKTTGMLCWAAVQSPLTE